MVTESAETKSIGFNVKGINPDIFSQMLMRALLKSFDQRCPCHIMIKYRLLASELEMRKTFDSPLANHFSPVIRTSQIAQPEVTPPSADFQPVAATGNNDATPSCEKLEGSVDRSCFDSKCMHCRWLYPVCARPGADRRSGHRRAP